MIKSNSNFATENKILFKISNKTYSTIDFENRKNYIQFVGDNNNIGNEEILKDFISSKIFYNYYELNNIKIDFNDKVKSIYNDIINTKNTNISLSDDDKNNIYNHLKYDLVRKTILENFLNNKKNEFNLNSDNIDLMYKYKIKYLNVFKNDLIKFKNFENIYDYNNILDIENFLKERSIFFFTNEKEISEIKKIKKEIRQNINAKKYFFTIENEKKISFISIIKSFETVDGLITNLFSFESKNQFDENQLNCNNLKNNNNIINKEYEYKKLNNQIKESLIDIGDYLEFENQDTYTYIILCEIKFNKELFSNIKINKKINTIVSKIEENFVSKYSKLYNFKLINE